MQTSTPVGRIEEVVPPISRDQLMIELSVLGSIRLEEDGRTRAGLREIVDQPKRAALLTYLAFAGDGRGQRRDRLLAVFWPELPSGRARAALRRALWYLRARLGEGVLSGRGSEEVALLPHRFGCDAVTFRSALAEGADERALELYAGPLLDGLFVRDAPEFEEWVAYEREGLRAQATAAALRLADRAERESGPEEADRWLKRALEVTPFGETAVRRRLSLLARSGQREEAVRAFDTFEGRLRREYDLEPEPETLRLVAAIRARSRPQRLAGAGQPSAGDGPAAAAWASMDRSTAANQAAIDLYLEWLKTDESSAEAYAGLAASYAHGVQLFGRARSDLIEAMRAGRLALDLDERLPQAHMARGLGLEFSGRLGEADAAYRMAIRLDRGRGLAMSQVGRMRMLAGDFAEAVEWAQRTSRISPEDPHGSLQIAVNLNCLELFDEGDRSYEATLAQWPHFPWAEASWAYFRLARGDIEGADQLCRGMLDADPDFAAARLTAGITALHAGRERDATAEFEALHRLDPDLRHGAILLSVRSFLAYLWQQRGDLEAADALLREAERSNLVALARGGTYGGIFYDQAAVCALRGDDDRALDWLDAALTAGYKQPGYVARDPLLERLRRHDRFRRWLGACRQDLDRQRS